jgi:hypothetical protein
MAKKSKSTPTAATAPPAAIPSPTAPSQGQSTSQQPKAKTKKSKDSPQVLKRRVLMGQKTQWHKTEIRADSKHIQKHRKPHRPPRSPSRLKPLKVQCSMSQQLQSPLQEPQFLSGTM